MASAGRSNGGIPTTAVFAQLIPYQASGDGGEHSFIASIATVPTDRPPKFLWESMIG